MATLSPFLFAQYSDDSGNPLSGGTITAYATGTSTPLDTYSDQAGTIPNANPVVLDSAGRATIYLGISTYDFILKNSAGATIKTYTAVNGSSGGGTASLQISATLADMRALPSGSSDYVILGGNTAVGDGGSYNYYWSSTSTATDDGVSIIRPSSNPATGRWLLMPIYTRGTFTATLTGVTATVQGTVSYVIHGKLVTLSLPSLTGTSNTTACTITGLPAALRTNTNQNCFAVPTVRDNSLYYSGALVIGDSTTIKLLFKATASGDFTETFTGAGTKGLHPTGAGDRIVVTYPLVNT